VQPALPPQAFSLVPSRTRILSSTPEAATEASELLLEVAEEWNLPEALFERILLVVSEAVANAAEHGNELDPSKNVRLTYELANGEVTVSVEHEGPGMDPERLQNASLPDDPLDTGGRGLYIIRELAERVWLEEEGRRMCLGWYVRRHGAET
jgi:serine/threonine-protein kinase RsbW